MNKANSENVENMSNRSNEINEEIDNNTSPDDLVRNVEHCITNFNEIPMNMNCMTYRKF